MKMLRIGCPSVPPTLVVKEGKLGGPIAPMVNAEVDSRMNITWIELTQFDSALEDLFSGKVDYVPTLSSIPYLPRNITSTTVGGETICCLCGKIPREREILIHEFSSIFGVIEPTLKLWFMSLIICVLISRMLKQKESLILSAWHLVGCLFRQISERKLDNFIRTIGLLLVLAFFILQNSTLCFIKTDFISSKESQTIDSFDDFEKYLNLRVIENEPCQYAFTQSLASVRPNILPKVRMEKMNEKNIETIMLESQKPLVFTCIYGSCAFFDSLKELLCQTLSSSFNWPKIFHESSTPVLRAPSSHFVSKKFPKSLFERIKDNIYRSFESGMSNMVHKIPRRIVQILTKNRANSMCTEEPEATDSKFYPLTLDFFSTITKAYIISILFLLIVFLGEKVCGPFLLNRTFSKEY